MTTQRVTEKLLLILILIMISSCGSQIFEDVFPNPAINSYHRMEFDVSNNGITTKELGIANIAVREDQDLSKVNFTVFGIFKGTLSVFSNSCGIDFNTNFDGRSQFKLSDFITEPVKCSIRFTAITDPLDDRQHNILETGIIKLNVIPKDKKALGIRYLRTNSVIKTKSKTYSYAGQGSMQRKAGNLTSNEKVTLFSSNIGGGVYRISGCDLAKEGTFSGDSFELSLKSIYKKDELTKEDSCDFEVTVLPNTSSKSLEARFSLNIYGKDITKLENAPFAIKKGVFKKNLIVEIKDRPYVVICSINDNYEFRKDNKSKLKCKEKYKKNKTYWIRSLTASARKSVYAMKNGEVIWKE